MPATEQAARLTDAHRTLLLRLRQAVVQRAVQSWQTVNFENLDGTFQVFSAATVALLTAAQRRGITSTDAYLAAFMTSELGPNATAPPEATVPTGVDQAGRSLTRAILPALIAVKVGLSQARPEPEALRLGRNRMVRTVASEVLAAPRAAQAEVMVLDDRIKGWRRVPGPGACGACLAAASGEIDSVEKPMRVHWHDRCAQEVVVRSVRERVIRPTGREMFDALSPVEQARMFEGRGGEEKAHLIRSGAVPFEALAQPMPLAEMADGITERPLSALQALAA